MECEDCGRSEKNWHLVNSKKFGKVLCDRCYSRNTRKANGSDEYRECEYCGISSNKTRIIKSRKFNKTLCEKHYTYYSHNGKLKRTTKDLNEIVEYKDYAEIILYNIESEEIARTKIDKEDIEKVSSYKWNLTKKNSNREYCYSNNLPLHRLIMGLEDAPTKVYVDHINRDSLDNRKENLRVATNANNQANSRLPKNNKSRYKGVRKSKGKWVAYIKVDYKNIRLGTFEDKLDAMLARRAAEEKYFGDFRSNNDEYLERLLKERVDN